MVKTRTRDWIGANCRNSESFKPLARRAMAAHIGDVYYLDLKYGSDSNDGTNWTKAFKTFNYAMDETTAYNNDYILVKDWKTETGTGVIATLDVAYTHWLGAAGLLNPYYPEKGTLNRTGESNDPYVLITAEFVEFGGFSIFAHQVSTGGSESGSVSKSALNLGTDASAGGNKAFVHNVHFPDWNHAENVTGLSVHAAHHYVLRDICIDNVWGNFDTGIRIDGATGAGNSAQATIEDIYCMGGITGAFTQAIKLAAASSLQHSRIDGLVVQRCTNAINLGAAFGAYCVIDNAMAGCVENSFFAGVAACDARDDLWTQYKWTVGENVSGYDAKFADS